MCGLAGVIGDLTLPLVKTFQDLLVFTSVRGAHSTGVASVGAAGALNLIKSVGNPYDLMDSKHYDSVVGANKYGLLGHGRHATIGSVSKANAHPFLINDDFVGAHNGTLDWDSKNRLTDGFKFGTDSEALLTEIYGLGVDAAMRKVSGSWALSWFDVSKQDGVTVNFLRNKERSLYCATTQDKKALLWSSEYHLLEAACVRNDVELDKVYLLQEDFLYTVKVPQKVGELVEWDARKRRKIVNYVKPPVVVNFRLPNHTNNDWGREIENLDPDGEPYGTFDDVTKHWKNIKSSRKDTLDMFVDDVSFCNKGPNNSFVLKKNWDKLVEHGCSACFTKDIPFGSDIVWLKSFTNPHEFICEECAKSEAGKELMNL